MKVLKDKILCNDTIKIFCCKLFVQKRLVGKIMIIILGTFLFFANNGRFQGFQRADCL